MQILNTRNAVRQWRKGDGRVALVPTMGNLHAGHMALVAAARARCERVIVSIFVNPLQFGPDEDLAAYPRTFQADCSALVEAGADAVFAPSVNEMYPDGGVSATTVSVSGVTEILCGRSRPGHFDGVATVVCKLFNIVRPDVAFFGEKDYQQFVVIRRMTADLCMDLEIEAVPTVRDDNGLALSSRNGCLSEGELEQAQALSKAIADVVGRLAAGERYFRSLEIRGNASLIEAGLRPDYFEIRDNNLDRPAATSRAFRVLAAAYLGHTRLIDNMEFRLGNPGLATASRRLD